MSEKATLRESKRGGEKERKEEEGVDVVVCVGGVDFASQV